MSVTRKLGHFLIAIVLTAFVLGFVIALPPSYPEALHYPATAFGAFFAAWLFSLPLVAIAGLVIGMPIAFVLTSLKICRLLWWAGAGALAGTLFSFLVFFVIGGPWPLTFDSLAAFDALTSAWIGFLPGMAAGAYWWAAIVRHDEAERGGA